MVGWLVLTFRVIKKANAEVAGVETALANHVDIALFKYSQAQITIRK
jgi:hypothetical protein